MKKTLTESLIYTLELVEAGILSAPEYFNRDNFDELLKICNACGAKGSRLPIPQTAYGMSLKPMCHIHDVRYFKGVTNDDKDVGDREMRNNGCRLIRANSVWWLKSLRKARVQTYYMTVHVFGGEAFWDGKIV